MNVKKNTLFFVLFITTLIGFGQCPPGSDVIFTSQADVEEFATLYPNCTEIGVLSIGGEDIVSLESISFLNKISRLIIGGNEVLTSLSGLENISSTISQLQIINNTALSDISQLHGITGYPEIMLIMNNDSLINLVGLQNIEGIDSPWGVGLEIINNDNLINLEGLEGLAYMLVIPEDPGVPQSDVVHVTIEGNDALQSLEGLGNILTPYTMVIENNASLPNLGGLQNQDSIYFLHVIDNNSLSSVDGLKKDSEITRFKIEDNNGLTDLKGLDSLARVGSLVFDTNENLQDLNSLPSFVGSIGIQWNNSLTGLSAFSGITGANIESIGIFGNDMLTSLSPLQDIENLRSLTIFYNTSLLNLTGLGNLKQIDWLNLSMNQNLTNIGALAQLESVEYLFIESNPSLTSLIGLGVDTAIYKFVTIKDNLNLPVCEAASICNFLQNFSEEENEVEIMNNAPGCNSRAEVEAACGIIGIDEVVFDSPLLRISPNPADAFFDISFLQENQILINEIRIFDSFGRLVYQNEPKSFEHKVSPENLPKGIYVVLVNGRYSEKLVIQH